jgi:hypothetical protein
LGYIPNGPVLDLAMLRSTHLPRIKDKHRTFTNLYIFRGLVCTFLLPTVLYFVFACNSGNGGAFPAAVPEAGDEAIGSVVVPVRWHLSTTSLKATSHKSFFPPSVGLLEDPPGCKASLKRRRDDLVCTFLSDGGARRLPDFPPAATGAETPGGKRGFSPTSCREAFGAARA